MDDDQQFCLRWNNHQSTLISVFDTLLENGTLVDCTLAAEGKFLKAHKVVLSACSPYFAALLSQQYDKHPIFILKDVKFQELRAMMDYMYRGEVNISQDQLAALLKAAESLQIKGLSDNRSSSAAPSQQKQAQNEAAATKSLVAPVVPANKASGLTIENKRPLKSDILESDVSGSREGSVSPTLRKRKKIRRRSVDNNNLIDNHDQHSNSSSHSMHTSSQPQPQPLTSSVIPTNNTVATSILSSATTPSNSSNVLSTPVVAVSAAAAASTKKTDPVQQQQVAEALKLQLVKHQSQQQSVQQQQLQQTQQTDDEERSNAEHAEGLDDQDSDNDTDDSQRPSRGGPAEAQDVKTINQSELMIEPKNEYDDGQDENVEDLTLDEEELLDDLDQAGPSHGGEGSSQSYAQWQMDREHNEAFMAAQDAVGGQHRDAQDILPLKSTPRDPVGHSVVSTSSVDTLSITSQPTIIKPTTISIVKVGASDVVTTAGTAVIPVGTTLISANPSAGSIGRSSTIINTNSIHSNQSVAPKKLMKATHPRIKYSKHKNPSVQPMTTLPILTIPSVSSTSNQSINVPINHDPQSGGTTTKIELLNFSLSRKFPGQGTKTIDVSNIQQIPISAITKVTPSRYTVNEYETSTSNTSQSNDFATGMMEDLDYSVIDDIELPDDVQVNFTDSYADKESHTNIEEEGADTQDLSKSLIAKKPVKSETKLLNTVIDDKYALLANTSIMKNFEYTVNESVISDNDDGEMRQYVCRHCGKRYRWKSTLRRHENVECGGKEAMHQCPYCTYRAKQRGNLGVHIRKHHSDMPQLESRRKSKNRDSLNFLESIKPESMEAESPEQM
ncbi:longitudinals lacking protein isoform X2 [Armigeres subalbatus]|uniref:longitudinals lacking protein isoform X2 n=1 Tax=Armigeres subalbatus TaxID=124917 RepID=UPI002ED031DF